MSNSFSTKICATLLLCLAGVSHTKNLRADIPADWPTTQPASIAVNQPDAIYCPDLRSFLFAIETARRTPNTHIKLAPVEYRVGSEIIINGNGTTIDGNGATIVTTAYYSGANNPATQRPTRGVPLIIEPVLGRPVPFKKQSGGLWTNPASTCMPLNKAAGGTYQTFYEKAPCQDASGEPIANYQLFAPYIIPAKNITIENLSVRYASPACDGAFSINYAQNVLIRKIKILNMPKDLGPGVGHGDVGCDGAQWVTYDACEGPVGLQMNSSLYCRVINCKMTSSNYEEGCRFCITEKNTLDSIRTNDLLCTDILFDHNTLNLKGGNTGAISGGTRILFTNNTCSGGVWCDRYNTRQCVIKGNHGTVFTNFAPPSAGNVIGSNP